MKRSRLNPKSKKTAKEDRGLAPIRRAYVEEIDNCPISGGKAIECHEIIGGSQWRHIAKKEPCTWLAVSREGHRKAQYMPKAQQLAYKFKYDHSRFDLERFNEIYRGGNEYPVTIEQILEYLEVRP